MATLTPFRYPGAKNKMLPILMEHIDKWMPNETAFTDAFVGGGSVALEVASKYPKAEILLNDKDYWMYSFWDTVCHSTSDKLSELFALIDQPATLEQFYKLRSLPDDSKVMCAYKAIFFNRTTFSGILKSGPIGGKNQISQYKVDCRYNATKIKNKIRAINKLLYGRTHVDNCDINDYLNYRSNQGVIYLDPPYVKAGKALYTEYMTEEEHVKMGDIILTKNKWVLSYDDSDIIRRIYQNCDIYNTNGKYSINGAKTQWSQKNELIIIPKF